MRSNRYVSYLGAEIEPQALANMRTFDREVEKTMQKISGNMSRGSGGFASSALGTSMTRNAAAVSAGAQRAKKDLDRLEVTQLRTGRAATVMASSFSRAADALQIVQGPLGPIAGRLSALGQVLKSLTGFTLAGVLAGGGAFALGSIATQYQKMHDTLVPVFQDQNQFNTAMNDVIGIAQRTHQALQPVADLYAQIGRVSKDAGISQQRAARLTETVSKATRMGGGSTEAQQAAIVQFGQALTANFHGSGQELQSILEQTPALAQAIAEGLGVQTSKLKELAKEGQLSTELVVKALEREADVIDQRFASMPPRIGKSLTDLQNNLAVFIGRMDEATGATTGVATAISFVADHLRGVVVVAGTFAAALGAKTFAAAIQGATSYVSYLSTIPRVQETITAGLARNAAVAQQSAILEKAAAEATVLNAREHQAQIRANIVILEKQIATQARALEMARTLNAGMRTSGGAGSGKVLTASYEELQASERALLATQAQLLASDAELAAAEARLTGATTGLAVATEELAVAEATAAASSGRLAAAKAVVAGAMGRVGSVAKGLVGFLGGPWGVAFTAAAGWATYLATRTDYAKEAIDRFAGGQEGLIAKLENTTGKMRDQAQAAFQLARALQLAGIAQAKQNLRDTQGQLSGNLSVVANKINAGAGGRVMPGVGVPVDTTPDAQRLYELANKAKTATLSVQELSEALRIVQRHPDATKGNFGERLFGVDTGKAVQELAGVTAAIYEVQQAEKDLAEGDKRRSEKLAPLLGNSPKPPTKAQLNAQARLLAAQDPLSKARAELQLAMQQGPKDGESNDDYKQRVAALIQNVNGLVNARKADRAATAAQRHEQAALNKEMAAQESARDKAGRLAGIMDEYTEDSPIKRIDKLRDAADKAKRSIQDLVGERIIDKNGDRIFSQADADRKKAEIDTFEARQEHAKPVQDIIDQGERELDINRLIASGLGDQAEFLRRKVEIEKQYGPLTEAEANTIRRQIADQNRLNDILDKRNAIIENNARFLDSFRDTVQSSIKSLLEGDLKGGVKNFFKGIRDAYFTAKANEITMKLIGDPAKKYRDEMTRGLNNSAEKLDGSASSLDKSADALNAAAEAIQSAATASPDGSGIVSTPDGTFSADSVEGFIGSLMSANAPTRVQGQGGVTTGPDGSIIVTAKRKQKIPLPEGIDSMFTKTLGDFGNSVLNMGIGAINQMFGGVGEMKGNVTGGGISDALGSIAQIAGQFSPEFAAGMAITSGISKLVGLPNFAGGAFGIGGNLIAKLLGFGKRKVAKGGVTLTNTSGDYSYSGNSSLEQNVTGAADSVTSGLQHIVDALGATLGDFRVSIGMFDGDYRVNTNGETGQGLNRRNPGTRDFNDDIEAAVRFAIEDAIQDGAIQGLRASTQRLLQSGHDLEAALDKAVKFEDVFKRLKRIKDPVGAAIDDLNTEFQGLIRIFTEAGASAEEWGQLQELYDLERADAIKQATQSAVSALDDFITSLTSGPESPLSRRTVYDNARTAVDAFRSDIASGKAVDQDALITALNNFEQASENLNGSRGAFYSDFNDILALAQQARDNVTSGTTTPTDPSTLPNPFDSLTPLAQQQLAATQSGNQTLEQIRDLLNGGSGVGTGTPTPSTIDSLPYYRGSTTGGTGSYGGFGSVGRSIN